MQLSQFQLVLLRSAPGRPDLPDAEADRIQAGHLAFYRAMRGAGHVVTNGPVRDQPDENLRGLAIFAAESVATARALAEEDPAVRAGLLAIEAMTWLCQPGTMISQGTIITID
jgi:uncharacterized protein YciI